MRQKTVLVLLFLYVIASTECHEILRLPLLVKHYSEHREQVNNLTFWEFLVLHYKTDVAHDDQDMSLPFKACHHSLMAPALAMPSQKVTLASPPEIVAEKIQFIYHSRVNSSFLSEIFQPPRG